MYFCRTRYYRFCAPLVCALQLWFFGVRWQILEAVKVIENLVAQRLDSFQENCVHMPLAPPLSARSSDIGALMRTYVADLYQRRVLEPLNREKTPSLRRDITYSPRFLKGTGLNLATEPPRLNPTGVRVSLHTLK